MCVLIEKHIMKKYLFGIILCTLTACQEQEPTRFNADEALDYCNSQVNRALIALMGNNETYDYTMEPRNILNKESLRPAFVFLGVFIARNQ